MRLAKPDAYDVGEVFIEQSCEKHNFIEIFKCILV